MIRRDRTVTKEVERAEIEDSIMRLARAMPQWNATAKDLAARLGTVEQLQARLRAVSP